MDYCRMHILSRRGSRPSKEIDEAEPGRLAAKTRWDHSRPPLWSVHSLHGKDNAWHAKERPHVLGCAFTELSRTWRSTFWDGRTTDSRPAGSRSIDGIAKEEPAGLRSELMRVHGRETALSGCRHHPTTSSSAPITRASSAHEEVLTVPRFAGLILREGEQITLPGVQNG